MEMDSFRRSFDRSRQQQQQQPNLKKPRLVEDLGGSSNRSFPQRPPPQQPPSSAAVSGRFRQGDRDSDDSSRGTYQPQNLQQQQQQHQELISQYKAALDELTFNSKPIITNLTIIAGENLLAAKAIASAICGNILEVPSDQKLPSLYLLDSIVKNIGRDYIKHFGAALPEVFCKTYRQVDSSTNSSMRHLFGTWKGVFPPQSLQMIEKELGFTTAVNGSSSGATVSRPDSLSQRQQQSIHVNPKYLEARQHLQPSSRAKGTISDNSGTLVNSTKDAERLDRASTISGGRPRADLPINKQRLPSEALRQHVKSTGASYGDYDYGSELSRHSGKGFGRDMISVTEQGQNKQFYGTRSSLPETVPRQRNSLDIKNKVPNYLAPQDGNSDMHLQLLQDPVSRNSDEITRSWKNSEEDEYMWDDVNSKSIDYTAVHNSTKAQLSSSYDKLELGNHLQRSHGLHEVGLRTDRESSVDSLSTEQGNQATFRHRMSPQLPVPESQSTNRRGLLATGNSSLTKTGIQPQIKSSHKGTSSFELLNNSVTGSIASIGQQKVQSSGDVSPARKSLILQRNLSPSLSADPRQKLHNFDSQDHPQAQSLPKSQGKVVQKMTSLQKRQLSSTQQPKVEQKLSESPVPPQKPPFAARISYRVGNPVLDHLDIQPKMGTPVATDVASELDIPPSLPSGSSPTQHTSSVAPNVSNPLSNLLSSLVAKGLISSNTDTPKNNPPKVVTQIKKSSGAASSNSKSVGSLPVSASIPVSTSSTEVLFSKPPKPPTKPPTKLPTKPSVTLNESITTDIKNLIGFEFKPDKVREFHPSVISDLLDDIPHQCSICGLRLKLQERLDQHLVWHASQKSESNCLDASRKWYANLGNWVSREVNTTPKIEPIGFIEEGTCNELDMIEHPKQMVPADEKQCLCILCGELFEDFYSEQSDKWMFEGATCTSHGLIVHAECMSDEAIHLLGLTVLDS